MRVVGSAENTTPRSSIAAHSSDVDVGEKGDEGSTKISLDLAGEDLQGRKLSASTLHPRKCNRKETWFTISQASEVTNPFRAVFKKREAELMESLEFDKWQYSVGLTKVTISASGRFCTVKESSTLEQRRTAFRQNRDRTRYCQRSPPPFLHSKICGF